jgi:hypothetical protein
MVAPTRATRAVRLLAVLVLLLAGCATAEDEAPDVLVGQPANGEEAPDTAPVTAPDTTPDAAPDAAPGSDAAPAPSDGADTPPVTLAFTGDVHAEGVVAQLIARGGDPFAGVAPVLRDADLSVVNLETAVGANGAAQDKQFTFLAPPSFWSVLRDGGVGVVSLANNHTLDFGAELIPSMLEEAEEHGIATVGAGLDVEAAYAPSLHDIDGRTVAVVGLTRVWPEPWWAATRDRPGLAGAYDEDAAERAVREAAELADHVVVAMHWGIESVDCPVDHQIRLADRLVDAGADVIAGHHPHVLQGIVERERALVAYSLGNFIWYSQRSPNDLTGVLLVTLDDEGVSEWELVPAIIDGDGAPQPVEGTAAASVLDRLERVSQPDCAP